MNRSIIGIIIFLMCLRINGASSNGSFLDSISIPGAKCKISILIDSNSCFSSFENPCSNYYFFNHPRYYPYKGRYSTPLAIDFTSSVKCTLFFRQRSKVYPYSSIDTLDTLPISCTVLNNWGGITNGGFTGTITSITATSNINIDWKYPLLSKRLATTSSNLYGDLLHFVLKSDKDSNDIYLSRTILYQVNVIAPSFPIFNKTKFMGKAYTINGELIPSNHRLPSVYILKDNATANSMVHLNKF